MGSLLFSKIPVEVFRKFYQNFLIKLIRKVMAKVIILALDGLSWNIINELMSEGQIKHIKELINSGASATLRAEGFIS